ncbi:MAG: hypothetical protein J5365_03860 [Erysipelotrichaceae bacterium]|nr:hypothetical protein [Erysipelotrichaceae bacterium]
MYQRIRLFFTVFLLALLCVVPVSANSAIKSWSGSDGNGVYTMEEDCPVVCLKEDLIFDIGSFPLDYFGSVEELSAYDASVTAVYTLNNPTESQISVRLVFPFGEDPQYFYHSSIGEELGDYRILVNDEAIEKKIRYSLMTGSDFDVETDVSRLRDEYQTDAFYRSDLPVYEYVFETQGIENGENGNPECVLQLQIDPSRQRLVTGECNYFHSDDDGNYEIHCYADGNNQEYRMYVLGEDLKELPEFTVMVLDGEETSGEMLLKEKNETVLLELILSQKKYENISDIDWYNACIDYLKEKDPYLYDAIPFVQVYYRLLRWYEYELNFEAGETLTNSVKAPIYPDINGYYEPAVYTYRYLLSPASTWADFSDLDITVNTAYAMIENSSFEEKEGKYTLHYDRLPEGELSFRLSESPSPKHGSDKTFYIIVGILAGALVIFLLLVIAVIKLIRKLIHK